MDRLKEGSASKIIMVKLYAEKRSLDSHRRRRRENIRIEVKEICVNLMNRIYSDRNNLRRFVNAALNLRIP